MNREQTALRRMFAGFIYVLLATFVWSIVPVGIKYLLGRGMEPFAIAFTRFVLASAFLWLVSRARGKVQPITRGALPLLLLGGLGMGGNYSLYSVGLQYTTASATNIIVQDEVIALVILSHFILGERIGWVKIAGMLASLAGIAIVFWNGQSMAALLGSKHLLGNIIIFFAGLSWPLYGLAQKLLSKKDISNTNGLMYIFAIAAVVAAVPAFFRLGSQGLHVEPAPAVFVWLFIVGVISTGVGYVLLARAFDRLTASTVGVVTCMLPIFTLIMANVFLSEPLTTSIAIGAAFVVAGIILIGREEAMR
ncbi:MAG: DMT family transporter [Armatimonadota bacterium]|nr:DMT family transporter [Armatimonadota bacterium]